jgi:hypothetical protein
VGLVGGSQGSVLDLDVPPFLRVIYPVGLDLQDRQPISSPGETSIRMAFDIGFGPLLGSRRRGCSSPRGRRRLSSTRRG